MNLCFLTHDIRLYGANTSLLVLLRHLVETRPEILLQVIVPGKGAFTQALEKEGIRYEVVSYERTCYAAGRQNLLSRIRLGLQFLTGTWRLFVRIRKVRPDLIYTNSSVLAHGLCVAKLLRVPHVWHVREFGLDDYGLLPIWGPGIQTWLLRRSNRLIFNSKALRDDKCDAGMRTNAEVVYNGVTLPVDRTGADTSKGDLHNGCALCFIGFLSEQKNVIETLPLLQRLSEAWPNTVLHLCGTGHGSVVQHCKEKAGELGISDRVIFHGWVEDIGRVLSISHFLVMPSRREAMGRVTAEALMHGVPVIGRNSGGTGELFEDGVHGFLYTDVSEVASRVLALSQADYDAMSEQASVHAASTFSAEGYGERIYQILKEEILR